ncbi:hypothetical protein [Aliiroseovarius subalbicans]|uniref:hypothetical protein n=1 Tax=Aliiroseovarius subalbicans TaxID=2925840 RepID=UPI001F5822E8|nr:hypothetical protein [Aliiroseovarius subalbicans]MCI2398663.1 hypothetical protein [Aliiroseovarius subalbicans]
MDLSEIETTLLFTMLPEVDFDALRTRLNTRLASLGLVLHPAVVPEPGCAIFTGSGLQLLITTDAAPLGAEAFGGAIAPDTTPANRAALTGIVARHGAHLTITICHLADEDVADITTARDRLQLAHITAAELARLRSPLAVHWQPSNRLMQRAAFEAMVEDDTPLELFLFPVDEVTGPRKTPGLRLHGARVWLGAELHAQFGALPRDVVRRAALAFVKAACGSETLITGQSFHHAGQVFRIAHAPRGSRIDLIPAAQSPLPIAPSPRAPIHRPAA